MKLYSVKSSAVRAAKAAGLAQYEIIEQDGQFGFRPVKAKKARSNARRTSRVGSWVPSESEALEQHQRELDEAQNPESVEVPAKLVPTKKPAAKSKRGPAKKAAPLWPTPRRSKARSVASGRSPIRCPTRSAKMSSMPASRKASTSLPHAPSTRNAAESGDLISSPKVERPERPPRRGWAFSFALGSVGG